LPNTGRKPVSSSGTSTPGNNTAEASAHLPSKPPTPTHRLLRGYAFDPSMATKLETALVSEIMYKVPWEDLSSGPIGEYVEVVDYDPASGGFYAPVNLNDGRVLAQNGLAPSEGNPQFHQQMVYAVAMTTIDRFERALGRKAFWTDRLWQDFNEPEEDRFVQRLRLYPHALRMANAYYSRNKGALLFGYFPGTEDCKSWANVEFAVPGRDKPRPAHDLISHTVFYKVGHHCSHNATLKKGGLELMNRDDLIAFIPLDQDTASKQGVKGWEMPAPPLFKALREKADGRVAISDVKEKLFGKAEKSGVYATETYIDYFLI
jgi:hypothetical protein